LIFDEQPELDDLLTSLSKVASLTQEQAMTMPPAVYTSQALLEREQRCIFKQQWLCAGRADAIAEPGAYITYQIGSQPIVVIRQEDYSVKAFANVCRHRMMQLLDGSGFCKQKRIVCPYHAWSYRLDGRVLVAPQMDHRPGFDPSLFALIDVRVECWQGWIYVTLDQTLPSVAETLVGLHTLVENYHMEHYVQIAQEDHVWKTNWKMLTENFMEGYHLPVAHKSTVGAYFPVEDTRFSDAEPDPAFTYQLFSKTKDALLGTAHADNTTLSADQRQTSIMPTVFPSHMYVLAPDHLWYLSLQPMGVDKVSIRYGIAIAPEVLNSCENPQQYKKLVRKFLKRVNQEDRTVVESIYRGAQAPLSTSGPLCWLERENHEFTQYLARRLVG